MTWATMVRASKDSRGEMKRENVAREDEPGRIVNCAVIF